MKEFFLEEYKSLIEDKNYRLRESRQLELLVIVGISAFYAWLYSIKPSTTFIWFLPVLLPLFGLF